MRVIFRAALAASMALALVGAGEASARTVPQGFYGVTYDGAFADAPLTRQLPQFDLMTKSGVESIRLTFAWEVMQPVRGRKPNFSGTDVKVRLAALRGIEVLPTVLYPPYWARKYKRRTHSPPKRNRDYARFIRSLIRRYGPDGSFWNENPHLPFRPIQQWQIWNEPNIPEYWTAPRKSSYGWPHGYGRLLRATNKVIKEEDPDARTVFAGLTAVAWRDMRDAYRRGKVRGHFDVAALQIYPQNAAREVEAVRRMRRELVRAKDGRRSMYITEVAFPASKGRTRRIRNQYQQTPAGMARQLRIMFDRLGKSWRRYRLGRIYWFTWSSRYGGLSSNFEYSGLLESRYGFDFKPQPALDVFRSSAQAAQGCVKDKSAYCPP